MTVAITGAVGLFVGLSLLWWGLSERRSRHRAELRARDLQGRLKEAHRQAQSNASAAQELADQTHRLAEERAALLATIEETQKRLIACRDPEALRQWLIHESSRQI